MQKKDRDCGDNTQRDEDEERDPHANRNTVGKRVTTGWHSHESRRNSLGNCAGKSQRHKHAKLAAAIADRGVYRATAYRRIKEGADAGLIKCEKGTDLYMASDI